MSKRVHLYEVDLLRASIILGVLCVHNMSFLNLFTRPGAPDNIVYEGLLASFHFTREAFMFITGLVLFFTYYKRDFKASTFWLKRLKLIVIPYVAWTIIYILFSGTYEKNFEWSVANLWHTISQSLLFGQQFFLYYLLISIQLYIFFPPFVRLMRKLERWHVTALVVSFLLELVIMWWNQVYLQNLVLVHDPLWLHWLIQYRDRNIFTYQFWFVFGGVAAVHYPKLQSFIQRRPWTIFGIFFGMLVLLWIHFYFQRVVLHDSDTIVDLVLQPIMVPYSASATLLLLSVGLRWSNVRTRPVMRKWSAFIEIAAKASFGVFLVHPLVLHFVEVAVYRWHPHPTEREWFTPVAILLVYLVSIAVARFIGNVPLLGYIVGQKADLSINRRAGTSPAS